MADPITVRCPSCDTSFPVDPDKVPAGGVRARCSECPEIFPVEDPRRSADGAEAAVEAEPTASPDVTPSSGTGTPDVVAPPEGTTPVPGDSQVGLGAGEEGAEPDEASPGRLVGDESVSEEASPGPGSASPQEAIVVDDAPPVEAAPSEEAIADEEAVAPGEATVPDDAPAVEERGTQEASPRPRFGQRTPEEKAQRLARVLVSDMITYNPELYETALERGTLKEDFEEEIEKSWEEYVEQVGRELATSTSYWRDALNEILARGEDVF